MGLHANQKKLQTFSKSVVCLESMGSVIGLLNLTGQEILAALSTFLVLLRHS